LLEQHSPAASSGFPSQNVLQLNTPDVVVVVVSDKVVVVDVVVVDAEVVDVIVVDVVVLVVVDVLVVGVDVVLDVDVVDVDVVDVDVVVVVDVVDVVDVVVAGVLSQHPSVERERHVSAFIQTPCSLQNKSPGGLQGDS